ncbi:Nitronate monooxygenase [Hondaea fermentalgiana]|uniref:Nitronate monooxygenase n=1 Tax=Hondaea fermentalgiana TaxID=2315210 RepID=A0A2R5GYA3_9STRA|nr:Nitronate monooxygenase [Hondaea fermentalgiana]|eukprot:GBG34788.1 Nitronate monooxygenase [Hondaea fermentalgiana]
MSLTIKTPLTELFKTDNPVMLAGMNQAAGPALAAAVCNAGGIGSIGGVSYTPKVLRQMIADLKADLKDKNAPFGVDLLLPQVGGNARKTNYDYTKGNLPALIDIIIEEKAALFISAVGVPPKWAVDKLHEAGIVVANMCGAPKHAVKAADLGVDIVIAQGGEGGGHTGDIPTSVLIPEVVDAMKGRKSAFTGKDIIVVAAGGIYDGRGLAMALALGAAGVWVGTRFIACKEAGAPPRHQQAVVKAGYKDTVRTLIYTGRPLRVLRTPYVNEWETNKSKEIRELTGKGVLPAIQDMEQKEKSGKEITFEDRLNVTPLLMGKNAGAINDIKSAKEIVDEMVTTAAQITQANAKLVAKL